MKQENKRAAIVSFKFYPQSDVTVENFPGVPVIQVMGFCLQFKATAAEFKETIVAGEGVNQQFSAVVTDLSADNLTYNRAILASRALYN